MVRYNHLTIGRGAFALKFGSRRGQAQAASADPRPRKLRASAAVTHRLPFAEVLAAGAESGCEEISVPGREVRSILGVDVVVATVDEALEQVVGCITYGWPGVWGFCNAHTSNVARRSGEFRAALQQMTIFNDGVGVNIASRVLYGESFPDNLNGTDLTPRLLDRLSEGTPIFLLGSPPGVAEEAAAALEARHGIRVVGTHHGFFAEAEEEEIVEAIRESGAKLVLVGMGHPRQELWAARHWRAIKVPVMCIGAFLDFSAGRVTRAPAFMRKLRLEWLYRLMLEPRRMASRYLVGNISFLLAVLSQRPGRVSPR